MSSWHYYTDQFGIFEVLTTKNSVETDAPRTDLMVFQEDYKEFGGKLPRYFCDQDQYGDKSEFYCLVCKCRLSGLQTLESHHKGNKHTKKVMLKKKEDRGIVDIPVNRAKVVAKKPRLDTCEKLSEYLETCGEAYLGLEFVRELYEDERTRAPPTYNCILEGCKSAWGTATDMFNHVKNSLHLKNYMAVRYQNQQLPSSKNEVIAQAGIIQEREGRDLNKIQVVYNREEYRKIHFRPRNWSFHASGGASASFQSANEEPIGRRNLLNPLKKSDPKSSLFVDEQELDEYYSEREMARELVEAAAEFSAFNLKKLDVAWQNRDKSEEETVKRDVKFDKEVIRLIDDTQKSSKTSKSLENFVRDTRILTDKCKYVYQAMRCEEEGKKK